MFMVALLATIVLQIIFSQSFADIVQKVFSKLSTFCPFAVNKSTFPKLSHHVPLVLCLLRFSFVKCRLKLTGGKTPKLS